MVQSAFLIAEANKFLKKCRFFKKTVNFVE